MRVVLKYNQITAKELQQKGYHVVFVQIGYKKGYIFGDVAQIRKIYGKRVLVEVQETHKNSITKQAMAMQMGKVLPAKEMEWVTYYAYVLTKNMGRYPAWQIL